MKNVVTGKNSYPYNEYTNPNILKIPIIYSETQADRWNYSKKKRRVHYLLKEMSSVKNKAKKRKKKTSNANFSKRHFFFLKRYFSVSIHSREMLFVSLESQMYLGGPHQTNF